MKSLQKWGKATRPGWCTAKVSYALNLTEKGELQGIIYRKKKEERGKKTVEVAVPITVPEMTTRSSGVSANFLCDNAKYMLGIDKENDEKSRKRAQECFEAAREKHLSILKNAQGKMAMAVKRFFENWNPEKAFEKSDYQRQTGGAYRWRKSDFLYGYSGRGTKRRGNKEHLGEILP